MRPAGPRGVGPARGGGEDPCADPRTDPKVLGFAIGAQLARRYRADRLFLVGDSADIVPPIGGLGTNTEIQDAQNLGWKIAAVLDGRAGPALLDTYHAERHPVGLFTMRQALARWQSRIGTGDGANDEPLVDYAAVAFGYRYRLPAALGAASSGAPALLPEELTGQPGTRAPHSAVTQDAQEISTIDLYGRRFVLLPGANGVAWISAIERVTPWLDISLDAYRFGVELEGAQGATAHGIGTEGALLVRPNGFVAWRAPRPSRRTPNVSSSKRCPAYCTGRPTWLSRGPAPRS